MLYRVFERVTNVAALMARLNFSAVPHTFNNVLERRNLLEALANAAIRFLRRKRYPNEEGDIGSIFWHLCEAAKSLRAMACSESLTRKGEAAICKSFLVNLTIYSG